MKRGQVWHLCLWGSKVILTDHRWNISILMRMPHPTWQCPIYRAQALWWGWKLYKMIEIKKSYGLQSPPPQPSSSFSSSSKTPVVGMSFGRMVFIPPVQFHRCLSSIPGQTEALLSGLWWPNTLLRDTMLLFFSFISQAFVFLITKNCHMK